MASTKLFNFRCPSELLQAVEDFAAAKGLTKSESAATLLRLGLQSQSVEVPATTPKPRKTEGETGVRHESETGVRHESETGVRHEGERLTELESKFESRLAALESRFESRLAAIEEGQRLGEPAA
ncbi:hypothetical protein [Kamptonema formosum]|uniref:hypothetical protein n=1 Tax=Kamptonema formosum TaxID=331992 RepID=UPI0003465941|nr:hypothetical protein [Oscillatoria sp. PCC 10802]